MSTVFTIDEFDLYLIGVNPFDRPLALGVIDLDELLVVELVLLEHVQDLIFIFGTP